MIQSSTTGLGGGEGTRDRRRDPPDGQPPGIRRVPVRASSHGEAARDLVIRLGVREANVYFDAFVPTGTTEPGTARG
jgi:hypothetical protein